MQYVVLIYTDPALMDALPEGQFDTMMRGCIVHADELKEERVLTDSRMLEDPHTARTLRVRDGRLTTHDGPFAETKEVLGGFNLIEADSMEEALAIASEFPWAKVGSIEVRPVRDFEAVRRRVGAPAARESAPAAATVA